MNSTLLEQTFRFYEIDYLCLAQSFTRTRLLLSEVCFLLLCRREMGRRQSWNSRQNRARVRRGRKESPADQTDTPYRSPKERSPSGMPGFKAASKTLFFPRAEETPSACQKPCQRPHPLASNGPRSPSRFPAAPAEAPSTWGMLGVDVLGAS